jgi:hypothetical protein
LPSLLNKRSLHSEVVKATPNEKITIFVKWPQQQPQM